MSSRKDLGVSSQEYEDAVILEKLYSLLSHTSKCSECHKRKPTHIDCNSHQFICKSCTKGIDNCKEVGVDRISSSEIKKLEKKYKSSSNENIKSSSHRDKVRTRKIRSPSPSSDSESSFSEPSHSRYSTSRHRSSTSHSKKVTNKHFNDDSSTPGMRSILMGNLQPQNQFSSTPALQNPSYFNNPNTQSIVPQNWDQQAIPKFGMNPNTDMNQNYSANPNTIAPSNLMHGMSPNSGINSVQFRQSYNSISPYSQPLNYQTSSYNSQIYPNQQSSLNNLPINSNNFTGASYNSSTFKTTNDLPYLYNQYPSYNSRNQYMSMNPSNLRNLSYSYVNKPTLSPSHISTQAFNYPSQQNNFNARINPNIRNIMPSNPYQQYLSGNSPNNPFNPRVPGQHLPRV